MARRVFGFLPQSEDEALRLIALSGQGPEEVSEPRDSDDVVLFVPGTEVALHASPLPTHGDRQSRQAAPFAVEDEVATPVEDLHFALGSEPEDLAEPRAIHVVSAAQMDAWMAQVFARGLTKASLIAEQGVVPEGHAIDIGPRTLGHGPDGPFSIGADLPPALLSAILADTGISVSKPGDPLAVLAEWYDALDGGAVDLRQGKYRVLRGFRFTGWDEWRVAAGLVMACGIAWLASNILGVRAMQAAADDVRGEIRATYQQAFPGQSVPADPVRAVSRALGDGGGGPRMNFLNATAVLYAALEDVPNASLRSVRYDPNRSGYVASVAYANYGDDATLKTALEGRGYSAVLGDARRGGQFVLGDVTLREGVSS